VKHKKVTIKDLAKILNISISTVSKAMNDSHEISELTKEKVRKAAEKYNYYPNLMAAGLHSKSTKTIGVVIPNILNYFFVNALSGIEKETRQRGYRIISCISNESYDIEEESIEMLSKGYVDGIILSLSIGTQKLKKYKHIQAVIKKNLPVVLFDRVSKEINCDKIVSDDYQGAYNSTSFLIENKCKNIALFTTHKDLNVVKQRKKGYMDAIENAGMKNNKLIANFQYKHSSEEAIKKFLELHKVDAVFVVDELLAIKTIKVAKELKLGIPNDIQVIGYADGELSKEYSPSVSVVNLHAKDIGRATAKKMIERLAKKDELRTKMGKTTVVHSTLIQRESTLNRKE